MDDDQRQRQNLQAAIAVILLIVLGAWALVAFKKSNDTMDCYAAHHRDCDPAPPPQ
jgi:hypothetical protein